MKKTALLILVFVIAVVLILIMCTTSSGTSPEEKPAENIIGVRTLNHINEDHPYDNLENMREYYLVYDSETMIVYMYKTYYTRTSHVGAAYLCPYYSEHGYLCRYNVETREIEEIIH